MKYTILLLFAFVSTTNLNAQQNKIGVRYGLGWHYVNGKTITPIIPKLGSIISINYEIERPNKTYFQFEINYEERGFQTETIIFENTENYVKFDYNYLAFPIKWGFKSRNKGKSYVSGRFGLVPSILLSAKTKETFLGKTTTFNVTDKVSRFDLGVSVDVEFYHALSDKFGLTYGLLLYQNLTTFTNENYFGSTVTMRHFGIIPAIGCKYGI